MPVILAPCAWMRVSWLRGIQAWPQNGEALSGMSHHAADTALSELAGKLHNLQKQLPPSHQPGQPLPPEKTDLTHLPAGATHFLGREAELAALDAAWDAAGKTALVELIAPGGTGKTALVKRWLDGMRAAGWHGAAQVYAWSFYSQGTSDARQASEDHFLAEALQWFGVEVDPTINPWDKGRKLAEAVAARRTLLILDGVEPLQYPPGPLAGELRAPGLKALLTHLSSAGQPGLCVLSSREFIKDVAEWVGGSVRRIDLGNLSDTDGASLLHALGATRAGAAGIGPEDKELQAASGEVRGHALTLSLLGAYLALAFEGDIRKRDQVARALLTRAHLRHRLNDPTAAAADLNEAEQIARRGAMKLHLADIALTRARLFHDRDALTSARQLIDECGYHRRLPELADAEAAAASWPVALL